MQSLKYLKILLIILIIPLIQGETFVVDPVKNAVWHNERGLYFLKLGNYLGAIQEFKIAISLNDNTQASASFYNNLGISYYNLQVYNLASECFEKAVNLDPNFLRYYENLINSYEEHKVLDNVIKQYEDIIQKDRYNSRAYLMLGLISKKQGNKPEAVMYLSEYVRLEPDLNLTGQIEEILRDLRK